MLWHDLYDFYAHSKAGDWCLSRNRNHIFIRLGDNSPDEVIALPIHRAGEPTDAPVSWEWNGNTKAPTLTPSILVWGNGRDKPATWHGFFTDGKLIAA